MIKTENILKLNFRLIIIHLFATLLICAGGRQFAAFTDLGLVEAISKFEYKDLTEKVTSLDDISLGERIADYFRWSFYLGLIGLSISFIISLTICYRRKIFWLNSVIVLFAIFFTQKEFFKLSIVKQITHTLGGFFIDYGLVYACIINGLFLTIVGLLLFLNKWTNNYISNRDAGSNI